MPIPLLIPVAVAGVATLVTTAVAVIRPRLPKKIAGKRVAILGARQVGKTTLLRYLRDGVLGQQPEDTAASDFGGKFDMEIDGSVATFEVPRDVPGHQELGFHDWREASRDADYLWYLFRADRFLEEDREYLQTVQTHLVLLAIWLDELKPNGPKVLFIGTHADVDGGSAQETERVVHGSDVLKFGAARLGAKTILGSLSVERDARRLKDRLGRAL